MNDMPSLVNCKLLLYADDSALIVAGKDVNKIQEQLSSELEKVREWLIENRLSLHLGKTESILFGSKKKLQSKDTIDVTCVKHIGITLDQSLSGDSIAENIIVKTNAKLKFLYRQARFINTDTKNFSH